jgi:hypothetical protein
MHRGGTFRAISRGARHAIPATGIPVSTSDVIPQPKVGRQSSPQQSQVSASKSCRKHSQLQALIFGGEDVRISLKLVSRAACSLTGEPQHASNFSAFPVQALWRDSCPERNKQLHTSASWLPLVQSASCPIKSGGRRGELRESARPRQADPGGIFASRLWRHLCRPVAEVQLSLSFIITMHGLRAQQLPVLQKRPMTHTDAPLCRYPASLVNGHTRWSRFDWRRRTVTDSAGSHTWAPTRPGSRPRGGVVPAGAAKAARATMGAAAASAAAPCWGRLLAVAEGRAGQE